MSLLLDDLDLGDGVRLAGATMSPQGEVGPLELVAPDGLPSGDGAVPMQIPLDLVDEDPSQPRQEFNAQALQELAETIRERGVRQPVSVRKHPEQAGRWMLNFGARRLRASRLAGRPTIPAFVDEVLDSYDQVIENEQREGLTPLELALFAQRRMAIGESQAEIARRLGKSRSYLSIVSAMIDPPAWLMDLYRSDRCRGMYEIYYLRRMGEEHPEAIDRICQGQARLTRTEVDRLRLELAVQPAQEDAGKGNGSGESTNGEGRRVELAAPSAAPKPVAVTRKEAASKARSCLEVWATVGGSPVRILQDVFPVMARQVYAVRQDTGERQAVDVDSLSGLRVVRIDA